jgi:hypothetical protein
MDSRFHGNDTNTIIVIPAKAGIHPMQDSFPRYLPKSHILLAIDIYGYKKDARKNNILHPESYILSIRVNPWLNS